MKFFGIELKFNGFDVFHRGNFNPDSKAEAVHNHIIDDVTNLKSELDVRNIPFVVGTQTATTSAWTGIADTLDTLVNGTTIRYWLPRTSTNTSVSLNLTLKDGSTTGAIACYYGGTYRLTTHYSAGTIILLTYVINQSINGTLYTGWWAQADYYSNNYDRMLWNSAVTAGATIYDYKILMQGIDGKFYPLTLETGTGTTKTISTQEFLLGCPILGYSLTSDVAVGSTTTNVYSEIQITLSYTANQASWTSQQPIYLKGTVNVNGNFVLDNTSYTSFITQTLPTTEDGFVYIMLGYMYSTTAVRLTSSHPMYEFKYGKLRPYSGLNEVIDTKAPINSPTFTGTVTASTFSGALNGNANTVTKLQTARNINLVGDVTGSTSFDGSGNVNITATVADDSHNHIISNVDGLQTTLDSKALITGTPTKKNINNTTLDYTDFVIPLCSLDNTVISADYFAHGAIFLKRGNILSGQITSLDIICGKNYNSTIPVFSIQKSVNSNLIKPVTFTYNAIKYFGLHVKITGSNYTGQHYFVGNASDMSIIDGIYTYNNNTSTIINSEIYNSLEFIIDSSLQKEIEFYKSPILRPMGDSTTYKIWNETNDGIGSGLNADKLDDQEGSYYLNFNNATNKPNPTITLGGDATGSVTLTDLASGTLNVTIADDSHNHIIDNIDGLQTALDGKASVLTATATLPATIGWYRIATSPIDITRCSARFEIDWALAGIHGQVTLNAGIMYGTDPTLNSIHYSHYSANGLTKARIVYHTTYSGNYAYLEVYNSSANALVVTVQAFSSLGWTLITPNTVGSIPTGYSSQELTFVDGIATEGVFSGSGANLTNLNASALTSGTVSGDRGVTAGSTASSFVEYNGTTNTAGQFYGGTTNPTGSTRLNYSGYFYPTYLNLMASGDTTTTASHYFVEQSSDGFVRPKTLANVRAEIVTSSAVTTGLGYTPANINSPTFTGTPSAPTPTTADDSTSIATTAFVKAQGYITSAQAGTIVTTSATQPVGSKTGDVWINTF